MTTDDWIDPDQLIMVKTLPKDLRDCMSKIVNLYYELVYRDKLRKLESYPPEILPAELDLKNAPAPTIDISGWNVMRIKSILFDLKCYLEEHICRANYEVMLEYMVLTVHGSCALLGHSRIGGFGHASHVIKFNRRLDLLKAIQREKGVPVTAVSSSLS